MNVTNKPRYKRLEHEFIWKVAWDATAIKLVTKGRIEEEAKKRLDTMLKRMEGGSEAKSIKLVDVRFNNAPT